MEHEESEVNEIEQRFEKFEKEFIQFERIQNPLHTRPDICAFLLLDKLVPGTSDMVSSAEHDEIFLDTDVGELNKVATDDDICTLVRCGVRYESQYDCLAMFV